MRILSRSFRFVKKHCFYKIVVLLLVTQCGAVLSSCDDDILVRNEENADTTSHSIAWQVYKFDGGTNLGPVLSYVLAVSDTDIWMTGDISVDTTVLSAPHGYQRQRINAIHYNGADFKRMLIEGIKNNGSINSTNIYGAYRSYGSTVFVTSMGCTEFRGDSIYFHDLRSIPYSGGPHNMVCQSASGTVFYYGGAGLFGRLVRKVPSAEIVYENIQIPTQVPVASLAEIGPEKYYLTCWWITTSESHLWKYDRGTLSAGSIGGESDSSVYWHQALWCIGNTVMGIHNQNLILQDVDNEAVYRKYGIPKVSGKQGAVRRMKGANVNDVFIVGDFGRVLHFNGDSVHLYDELHESYPTASFLDIAVTKDKVYIVGEDYRANCALFIVGTRK